MGTTLKAQPIFTRSVRWARSTASMRDVRDALVALVLEVMLGQPQGLVPERVGGVGQRRRGVERLGQALVGVPAVVGGHARQPTPLQLDVADVERREARDHPAPAAL